jgi:uncharacterized protein (UPF0332 family)
MTMAEGLKGNLQAMMQKSHRALKAARTHFKTGDYDFASSKADYATFYMMETALTTKGLSFSKHSAVISAFNRNFVKEGIFQKEYSSKIARLFKQRQIGDYEFELTISKKEAGQDIEDANKITEAIEKYLKNFVKESLL